MVVDTKKESLCINRIVGEKKEVMTVEGDVIIPDIKPDILNTINCNGTVCIYKREVLDGKIRIDGSINIYVMYLADNETESVRSLNTSLDFTEIMDFENCMAGMMLDEFINITRIECKVLNGRKINIKSSLEIKAKVYSNENINVIREIEGIEDIQLLNNELKVNSLLGTGVTKIYAKENLQIDNIDNLAEILKSDIRIMNKEIKVSYNKVLAKAELEVKIMYLTEDNRINCIDRQIPIMGFIDMPNVSDENICDTKYKIKNMILKPNNTDEQGIYIEVEIELSCCVYETKSINIINDLYSPSRKLEFTKKEIEAILGKEIIRDTCNINQQVQMPEISGNKIFDVDVKSKIVNQNMLSDKILYEGELELTFIYDRDNNGVDVKNINLPFTFSISKEGIGEKSNIETNIVVKTQDFIVQTGGLIDCNISLDFELNISKNKFLNIIEDITEEENDENKNPSMIVYFVKTNDTLWNIAKKFGSTVEDIVRVNEIEDKNKIYPKMQLFIPRYTSRKTA